MNICKENLKAEMSFICTYNAQQLEDAKLTLVLAVASVEDTELIITCCNRPLIVRTDHKML
jgi:hypothetical protein